MRLLPKEQDWTAYAWLIYLLYFVLLPFMFPSSAWDKAATLLATAVALPMYFAGYWLRDRKVLLVVAGFILLGSLAGQLNPGASVMFVYGAAYLGKVFAPETAYKILAAEIALIGFQAWMFHWHPALWIPAIVFTALIGSVIIQQFAKRRLTGRLLMAQDEAQRLAKIAERERIARDLHDLLGHTLSVIILKSELASRLAASDPERAVTEIRDVEQISREALAQVRSAVRGYKSAGFESELAEARRALETAGIRVETTVDTPRLSPSQEGVFGLALREGVTNVVRHAQASTCRLSLRQTAAWYELEIADNGRGGALEEGNGLSGMRERVEALGGRLERDGSSGTVLRIRVPA